jgi:hypothetical protein
VESAEEESARKHEIKGSAANALLLELENMDKFVD